MAELETNPTGHPSQLEALLSKATPEQRVAMEVELLRYNVELAQERLKWEREASRMHDGPDMLHLLTLMGITSNDPIQRMRADESLARIAAVGFPVISPVMTATTEEELRAAVAPPTPEELAIRKKDQVESQRITYAEKDELEILLAKKEAEISRYGGEFVRTTFEHIIRAEKEGVFDKPKVIPIHTPDASTSPRSSEMPSPTPLSPSRRGIFSKIFRRKS